MPYEMKDEILEAKELLKAKSVNQTGPPPSEGVLDRQLAQYRSLLQFDEAAADRRIQEARELELSKAWFADFIRQHPTNTQPLSHPLENAVFRTPIAEAVVETQNNARQTHQYIAVDSRNNNNLPTSGSGYGLGLIGMAGPLVLIVSAMVGKVFL
uniref:Uncharacterized protein n=1 Tax=Caulerpa okamurae TaxID=118247 RepID=A0A3S5FWS8_9CHLO|nr:hypothetical protein [Caulerpa okamurae]